MNSKRAFFAAIATSVALASPLHAANLLQNPEFDLDPTSGNGWTADGTGSLSWNLASGQPTPPSARTTQVAGESMILWQCVQIVGGATYDFSSQSFTHSSILSATNSVSLSVYASSDCSGGPLQNVPTNAQSFPNWGLREYIGYVAPMDANSARIELASNGNADNNDISWDNVVVDGPNGAPGAESGATFEVTKVYSDGNPDEVEVTLTCNGGLPLEQSFTISDGNPVLFVITNFIEGATDCEVTETGSANGYTPSYDNGSVVSDESCLFESIDSGEYSCAITNNADPASFTVTKEWIVSGAVGVEVIEEASVTIYCNNEIAGGFYNGSEYQYNSLLSGDGDFVEVSVDTTTQSAQCRAVENVVQSGVESDDDCGQRTIPAGGASSCTITNTVFFEGIPTLGQFGKIFMILLLLGVGLVTYRRLA